jgi:hypothetical protein
LVEPAPALADSIAQSGEYADWWTQTIASIQKDRIITGFATAVGVNMSFLLPYSMLRKGWGTRHRGLAIFDLSLGLIIPFVLATGCVVIAAASQFHARSEDVLKMVADGDSSAKEVQSYNSFIDKRLKAAQVPEAEWDAARRAMPEADQRLAAMLAERDNLSLAETLSPLVGDTVAQKLFGIGVLGMALSTIIILMLINGFAFCELIGVPCEGTWHRIGSLIPAVGVVGPFVWGSAAPALATPTSVIGGAMLPIAYFSFLLLMNSKLTLGDSMPTGGKRLCWNVLMIFATGVAMSASIWGIYGKSMYGFPIGNVAIGLLVVLLVLGLMGFLKRESAAGAGR